jgi:hypothetical protein
LLGWSLEAKVRNEDDITDIMVYLVIVEDGLRMFLQDTRIDEIVL